MLEIVLQDLECKLSLNTIVNTIKSIMDFHPVMQKRVLKLIFSTAVQMLTKCDLWLFTYRPDGAYPVMHCWRLYPDR